MNSLVYLEKGNSLSSMYQYSNIDPSLSYMVGWPNTNSFFARLDCRAPYLLQRLFPVGGLPEKKRVCGPFPKILTLFMTKICDILRPIYDLTKNSIPYLRPDC